MRGALAAALAALAVALLATAAAPARAADTSGHARTDAADRSADPPAGVRAWTIPYRAHNGARRTAVVLLPASYASGRRPPLPLVISPHGRGLTGRANSRIWGDLPARGGFAVVNPDGQGRVLPRHSWGFEGQVDDLARMPQIVVRALPWLRVDRSRVYAVGGSMGGQESLLLLARYPRLLAGAAVFDSVTDFATQYRRLPLLACSAKCTEAWGEPVGTALQKLVRREVGGSPGGAPGAFAARSPLAYAYELAFSCVPLQLWWSVADRVVTDQLSQSGRLFWELRRLNPHAPVHGFAGFWQHSAGTSARSPHLRLALATLGLLPQPTSDPPPDLRVVRPSQWSDSCVTHG